MPKTQADDRPPSDSAQADLTTDAPRERPILFSGPLVRAILDGSKTQTRRVMKPQPMAQSVLSRLRLTSHTPARGDRLGGWISWDPEGPLTEDVAALCPFGRPGDRLWVRESWMPADHLVDAPHGRNPPQWIRYRADGTVLGRYRVEEPLAPDPCRARECPMPEKGWRPSIHMPRWASRITLEVTGVRVERLQAITDADALAEGVERNGVSPWRLFQGLWEGVYGEGSWAANPWVWVVEFKRVEVPRG